MQKISKAIVGWCRNNYQLEEGEYSIVEYGIQLFLNTFLKVIVILVIGLIIGCFEEVLTAMFVFGGIRKFAGGVHCKTDLGCFSAMLCICLSPILMFEMNLEISKYIWIAISGYSLYEILRYAPRNSKVNPIFDSQILRRNRIGSIVLSIIAVIFLFFCPKSSLGWLVAMPLFIEAVTISPIFYGKEM